MRTKLSIALFAAVVAISCSKQEDGLVPLLENAMTTNPIRWDQLAVGQTTYYLRFEGEYYFQDGVDAPPMYQADTLILEIIAQEGEKFRVQEYLSPGSISRGASNPKVAMPDVLYQYYFTVRSDSLVVEPLIYSQVLTSRFFPSQSITAFPFETEDAVHLSYDGWGTTPPNCVCVQEGTTESLSVLGETYLGLSTLIDNAWMAADGPGFTATYKPSQGIVRYYAVEPWFQTGTGWDLLP